MEYIKSLEDFKNANDFYRLAYFKQLETNKEELFMQIDSPNMKYKIMKYIHRYYMGISPDEEQELYYLIKEKIKTDELFSLQFLRDPVRQNIYETNAYEYLINLPGVNKDLCINYPNNRMIFVNKGKLTHVRPTRCKSIDFRIVLENGTILFISHKYINENGGAQDNQFHDVHSFIDSATRRDNDREKTNIYYIAICDGHYFNTISKRSGGITRLEYLKSMSKRDNHVWISSISNPDRSKKGGDISQFIKENIEVVNYDEIIGFDKTFEETIEYSN